MAIYLLHRARKEIVASPLALASEGRDKSGVAVVAIVGAEERGGGGKGGYPVSLSPTTLFITIK